MNDRQVFTDTTVPTKIFNLSVYWNHSHYLCLNSLFIKIFLVCFKGKVLNKKMHPSPSSISLFYQVIPVSSPSIHTIYSISPAKRYPNLPKSFILYITSVVLWIIACVSSEWIWYVFLVPGYGNLDAFYYFIHLPVNVIILSFKDWVICHCVNVSYSLYPSKTLTIIKWIRNKHCWSSLSVVGFHFINFLFYTDFFLLLF